MVKSCAKLRATITKQKITRKISRISKYPIPKVRSGKIKIDLLKNGKILLGSDELRDKRLFKKELSQKTNSSAKRKRL
ncbi:MAG: hypothetical protein EBR30_19320 [Cytophagia bacterium]|nr:hypothetical protein [Cytophagia bacterium]NBW37128.1 hypothetical protein [Cytophagia bacterium]